MTWTLRFLTSSAWHQNNGDAKPKRNVYSRTAKSVAVIAEHCCLKALDTEQNGSFQETTPCAVSFPPESVEHQQVLFLWSLSSPRRAVRERPGLVWPRQYGEGVPAAEICRLLCVPESLPGGARVQIRVRSEASSRVLDGLA